MFHIHRQGDLRRVHMTMPDTRWLRWLPAKVAADFLAVDRTSAQAAKVAVRYPAVTRHLCASRGSISGIPTCQDGTLT